MIDKVKNFKQFVNENYDKKIYSGQDVYEYFLKLGSENSPYDNPISDRRKEIIGNQYILKDINIDYILKNDVDMNDFVKTQSWEYTKNREIDSFGLIGDSSFTKDVVVDGFHRLTQKVVNGDNSMSFFVPIDIGSKYEKL
jgi:hypothetical protein